MSGFRTFTVFPLFQVREIYEKFLELKDVDVTLCYVQVNFDTKLAGEGQQPPDKKLKGD